MKKSLMFLLSVCILFSVGYCTENKEEIVAKEDNKIVMTIDEVIDYAMKNNANIVDIKKLEKEQKKKYDDAKHTYNVWKDKLKSGGYAFDTPKDYLDCWGYSFNMAKLGYNKYLNTKGSIESTVEYSIRNIIYSINELENTIKLLEQTVVKQEVDVKISEVKYNLNMITKLDFEKSKQDLALTKIQLSSLKPNLTSLKINLKSLMGMDVKKELEITLDDMEFKILDVEELDKVIEESIKTNGKAIDANIEYGNKQNNYILATKTHFLDRDQIWDAKKNFADADIRLSNSINSIKNDMFVLYSNVKNSEEKVILSKSEYEQLKIKFTQMEKMNELGMITTHSFNSYKIALSDAKNKYEKALHENLLLNKRWEIALKFGDVLNKGV